MFLLRKPKTTVVDCHEAVTISSEHRIFSCFTVVEHFDTLRIPILYKLMVSIKLKLISFVVVVTLIHCSGVVSIFSVLIPYALYKNTWWIFLILHCINILKKVLVEVFVPLMMITLLIINDNAKSLRMCGFVNKRFKCRK